MKNTNHPMTFTSEIWQFIFFCGGLFLCNTQLAYAQLGTSIEIGGSCISGGSLSIPYVVDVNGRPGYDGTGFEIDGTSGLQISVTWDGSQWLALVGGGTPFLINTSNTANPNSTLVESWTTQGVFTCEASMSITGTGTIGGTFPIRLLDFRAERFDETIQLNWATASELNNKGFEIEQSEDGQTFEQIGFVEGAGTSNEKHQYEFRVWNPEAVYFRFKQIDLDGSFSFSPTRFIAALEFDQEPLLFPNPFAGSVSISNITNDTRLVVNIVDMQGRPLANFRGNKVEVEEKVSRELESYTTGMYYIHFQTPDQTFIQMFKKE